MMSNTVPLKKWWQRRSSKIGFGILIFILLAVSVPVVQLLAFRNLHEVAPGKFYRSAQMTGKEFRAVIDQMGIRSIINLRGVNDTAWYRVETNTTFETGVKHYDFPLSASQEVSVEEMEQIVKVLHDAPKPMLIHCKNGADRTGLVSALYEYTQEGQPPEKAYDQLTIRCFHFPHLFWYDTIAMDHSFWRYVNSHPVHAPVANVGK